MFPFEYRVVLTQPGWLEAQQVFCRTESDAMRVLGEQMEKAESGTLGEIRKVTETVIRREVKEGVPC